VSPTIFPHTLTVFDPVFIWMAVPSSDQVFICPGPGFPIGLAGTVAKMEYPLGNTIAMGCGEVIGNGPSAYPAVPVAMTEEVRKASRPTNAIGCSMFDVTFGETS
jgi:hypothetical protein